LQWTAAAQEAFQQAKRLLAAAVPLQHPAPNVELSLATNASDTHIGGVMQQKSKDHWQPLGFFSLKLSLFKLFIAFNHKIYIIHYLRYGTKTVLS
jgi:hypothetical protein